LVQRKVGLASDLEEGTEQAENSSFILERKVNGTQKSSAGVFSVALIMCFCCVTSFFSPIQDKNLIGGEAAQTMAHAIKS